MDAHRRRVQADGEKRDRVHGVFRCSFFPPFIVDDNLYPTQASFYVNGALANTLTSTRFFSYNDYTFFLGSTPSGTHLFRGRLFYLMVVYSTASQT